jgi:hypothetical protein
MNLLLIVLNCLGVTALALLHLRRNRFNLLDPSWAFLGGYAINYCVRPSLFAINPEVGGVYQDYIYPAAMIRQGANGAILFSMVGLIGFAAGDMLFPRAAKRLSLRLPIVPLREVIGHRLYGFIALVFFLLGGVGLYGFVRTAGWSGPVLELLAGGQRDAFMQVILGHGYFTLAMQLSIVGWALICAKWVGLPRRRTGMRRVLHALLRSNWFVGTLLIWVAFGERLSILAVVFIPLAFRFTIPHFDSAAARRERQRAAVWALAGVLIFVAIAGPIGLMMKGKDVDASGIVAMAISAWDSFEFTVAAQHSVGTANLAWGSTYLSDFVYTWLPRAVFPWKPERYGAVVIQDRIAPDLRDSVGATFPSGLLVEAYANFWYFGVFLVPMGLAIVFRAIYHRLQAQDWFWIVQMALLFPMLASFRSIGWAGAALTANLVVVGSVVLACSWASGLHRALRNLPAFPAPA